MEQGKLMSREEATDYLLAAKKAKGLTFEEISTAVGRDKVWVTAAIMGQATMSKDEAEKTVKTLGLAPNVRIDVACGKKWKAGREREKGSESTTNGRVSQSGSTKVSESGVAVGGGSGAGVGSIELVSLSMEQALW